MLEIAVCEDEQADRDNLIGILKPLLDKCAEEYRITIFISGEEPHRLLFGLICAFLC